MKNNLLSVAESTQCEILFTEDWITNNLDGLLVVTIKPPTPNNRRHIVL